MSEKFKTGDVVRTAKSPTDMMVVSVQTEAVIQQAQVRVFSAGERPPPLKPPKRVPFPEPVYVCAWVDPTGARRSGRFRESQLTLA